MSPSSTPTRKLDVKFENTSYTSSQIKSGQTSSSPITEANRTTQAPQAKSVEQSVTPVTTPIAPQISRQFTVPKEPKTMTEFTRDWRMCKSRGNPALYQYMKVMGLNWIWQVKACGYDTKCWQCIVYRPKEIWGTV